jgi:hypothetical protein
VRAGFDAPPAAPAITPAVPHAHGDGHEHDHGHDHGHHHEEAPATRVATIEKPKTRAQLEPKLVVEAVGLGAPDERGWLARVVRYAYVEMLDDLALSLVVGVLLSGAIVAALPPDVFQSGITHGFPALILMLLVGIPFYVCALTSTPIAAALIAQGLSPGAAFVFLLAGPATNAASLVMLSKVLGRRVVIVQLVTLSIAAVALGWLIDRVYPWLGGAPPAHVGEHVEHAPGVFAIASAAILGVLLAAALARSLNSRPVLESLRETA